MDSLWHFVYDCGVEIELVERKAEELEKIINEEAEKRAVTLAEEKFNEKQEKLKGDIENELSQKYAVQKCSEISPDFSFASTKKFVDGQLLSRNDFINYLIKNDPIYYDKQLVFNSFNNNWELLCKKSRKFISGVRVSCCWILNATGPGACLAFIIYIFGRDRPLIFIGGNLSTHDIINELEQENISLHTQWVAEAFRRSLYACSNVWFLTIPNHAGWNLLPDGKRRFISSENRPKGMDRLFEMANNCSFRDVFQDIVLTPTTRSFNEVLTDYQQFLPDELPIKTAVAISFTSRFLPFFMDEGLVQDKPWIIESSNDNIEPLMGILYNRTEGVPENIYSSEDKRNIERKFNKHIDCTFIVQHRQYLDNSRDLEKILKLFFCNMGSSNDLNRVVPVLIVEDVSDIAEETPVNILSVTASVGVRNIELARKIMGELHYILLKYAEQNPGAMQNLLKAAIANTNAILNNSTCKANDNSSRIFLATAILLKKFGVFADSDVQSVNNWLTTKANHRTSKSGTICRKVGSMLSELICNNSLPIAAQFGPPFWNPDKAFIASDDSLNVPKAFFDNNILYNVQIGRNRLLQYLKEEDVLLTDKGEKQKSWTVETEYGKKPRRCYSFSRDCLTPEANRIIDESIASDLFHRTDESIENFFPFIRHQHLDLVAGQVITDYKHGTPFIAVTGSVGSGKTDWTMMQVVQRAKVGDVVVVFDPTNAFCREELSGHKIPEGIIDNHFNFWNMSTQGWPVNILDFSGCEDITQRVQRLSSLLISGMHLTGPNQKAIVMTKAEEWLREYEINNNLSIYNLPARFDENAEERKLKMKLDALLSTVKDMKNDVQPPGWNKLLCERGKVLVISAGNATINGNANPFDILFDTLYSFKDKNRDGKLTVILDEVQTLNHRSDSTLVNILSRVRKLDISVILASQDYLNRSLAAVYKYCGTHILFRPLGEECIKAVAELTKLNVDVIRTLPDFCCAIMGAIYSEYSKRNIQLKSAVIGKTYRPPYVGSYENDEK